MAWTTPETAVAGQVLTAAWLNQNVRDNLDALDAAGANDVGLVLIDETDFTSSTSIVPGGAVFSADYDNYKLVIVGKSADATTRAAYIRMRSGATSASGNNYQIAYAGRHSGNSDVGTGAINQTSGYIGAFSNSSLNSLLIIDVGQPYVNTETVITSIHGFFESSNSYYYSRMGSVIHYLDGSYDRFEILPIAACTGTVRTYAYKGA